MVAAFTVIYAALVGLLVTVELIGVARKSRGDTLSEHWWWIQDRFPVARWLLGGFLVWAFVHLLWGG